MFVEVLLQLLVGVIDAQLLKAIGLQEGSRIVRFMQTDVPEAVRSIEETVWVGLRTLKFSNPKMSSKQIELTVDFVSSV